MDLDQAADQLYGGAPDEFIAGRTALVKAARAAGDRELAARIGELRRPTVAAWLLNCLSRDDPGALAALSDVGSRLRQAQRDGDGAAIRALGGERRTAIAAALTAARTAAAARGAAVSEAVRAEIEATLASAVLDPASATALADGRLAAAIEQVGFGDWSAPSADHSAHERPAARPALRAVPDLPRDPPPTRRSAADKAQEKKQQLEQAQNARRATALAKAEAAGAALDRAQEEATAAQQRVDALQERLDELRAELAEATAAAREANEIQRRASREAISALRRLDD